MIAFFVRHGTSKESNSTASAKGKSRLKLRLWPAAPGRRLAWPDTSARVPAAAWMMSTWLAIAWLAWSGGCLAQSESIDERLSQAQQALNSGKPEQSESLLSQAIKQTPGNADFYLLRSRARESQGKFKAALEDASKYIELLPQEAYGYLNRAHIHLSLDRPQDALADANRAIALEPDEPDGYYRRADVYQSMGRTAEARADEARAEELNR